MRMVSRVSRSVMRTPPRAARSVAIDTTSGIARPSACGQAMTRTVIVRTTADSGIPRTDQVTAVIAAAARANQNSHPDALSANLCALDEDDCASATSFWIPARVVSSPMAVTSARRPESTATVPAVTTSPASRRTGRDSPVIIDSSMLAEPSTTTPSAGTDPPGRISVMSPATMSAAGMVVMVSLRMTSASSGSSAAREPRAFEVCAMERISIQCPSNMMTTSSASSHQKSRSCASSPSDAPQEAPNATVIAMAMSSIMPGERSLISCQPPVRNGRPPQRNMAVPRIGEIHVVQPEAGRS